MIRYLPNNLAHYTYRIFLPIFIDESVILLDRIDRGREEEEKNRPMEG